MNMTGTSGRKRLEANVLKTMPMAVPPGDDVELRLAITHIMKHDDLRKRYAKNAAKYVTKQLKWSIVARKHLALYEKLIADLAEERRPKKKESPF